ncbi:MAG: hypothetical protein ACM37W_23075 [Actinomycetota bacterium]
MSTFWERSLQGARSPQSEAMLPCSFPGCYGSNLRGTQRAKKVILTHFTGKVAEAKRSQRVLTLVSDRTRY